MRPPVLLLGIDWARSFPGPGVGLVFDGAYRLGWGLLVPAVIVTALAGLGWLLPEQPPPPSAKSGAPLAPNAASPPATSSRGWDRRSVRPGVLSASFGYSVYAQSWTLRGYELVALGLLAAGAVVATLLHKDPLIGLLVGTCAGIGVLAWSNSEEIAPSVLVAVALLLVVLGCRLYWSLVAVEPPGVNIRWRLLALSGLVLAVGYALVVAFPFWSGEQLGGVGILMLFALVLTCVGSLIVWISPALPIPRALRVLGITRFPVVLFLVAWFAIASWRDGGGYHNVRLKDIKKLSRRCHARQGVRLLARQERPGPDRHQRSGRRAMRSRPDMSKATSGAVPLILVATTGGGIRAAFWTSLVLDCAFEVEPTASCPSRHPFQRVRAQRPRVRSQRHLGRQPWPCVVCGLSLREGEARRRGRRLGEGAASKPTLSRRPVRGGSSSSYPGRFFSFAVQPTVPPSSSAGGSASGITAKSRRGLSELSADAPASTASALERYKRRGRLPLRDFAARRERRDGQRGRPRLPLHSSVRLCRRLRRDDEGPAHRSVLPATRDLIDFLCGDNKDVRLSTAALLSARFPFVNPSARVKTAQARDLHGTDGTCMSSTGATSIRPARRPWSSS